LDAHLERLRGGVTGLDMAGMISHHNDQEILLADANVGHSDELWDFPIDDAGAAPKLASSAMGTPSSGSRSFALSPDIGAFVSGDAIFAQQKETPDLQPSNYTTAGTTGGVDYRFNDKLAIGALFSYTHTNAHLDDVGSTAQLQGYIPGIYASYFGEHAYADGLLSYGRNSYSAERHIAFDGFERTAQSATRGHQVIANLSSGLSYAAGAWRLGPTAGVQYVQLKIDGFTESGADAVDLVLPDQKSESLQSRLGGRLSRSFKLGRTPLNSGIRAAWQHEYRDDSRAISAAFNERALGTFTVQTTAPQRDSALAGLTLSAQVSKALTLSLDYDVQTGQSRYFAQSIRGGGSLRF